MRFAIRKFRSLKQIYFAGVRIIKNAAPMRGNLNPILVFGYQKSGTSAIASILAYATSKSVTNDIFYKMGDLELRILEGKATFADVLRKGDCYFRADIVKEPEFLLFVKELTHAFPDSQRVFIIRDPFENIRSILNRLRLPGHLKELTGPDMARIQRECPLWIPIITDLYSPWKASSYVEQLAARWNFSAVQYLSNPDNFVLARYEDFIRDKPGFIVKLAASLGLNPSINIDTVADRQFQPRGQQVCPLAFFGEDNCHLILKHCEESLGRFGYKIPAVLGADPGQSHVRL